MRRLLIALFIVAAVLVALAAAIVLALVDDWSRDLTTNVAETSAEARDTLLRPLRVTAPRDSTVSVVHETVARLPRWRVIDQERNAGASVLRFVRSTRWFGFKDDVTVRVVERDGTCEITAVSRSRVGRGDLGQNPRNLRELMGSLRRAFARQPGS